MNTLFIGNIIALIGCILMVAIGFIKEKKNILIVQCFQFGFLGIANLILGATSGFIAGFISIARNIAFAKIKSTIKLKFGFVILQLSISLLTMQWKWIELLPIIATILFTFYIDTKSEVTLKKVIIITLLCWVVYDASYSNYVSLTFDILTILSNFIGILMIIKAKKLPL